MPDFVYSPAPVLVEATGNFAIGSTGVLRPAEGGAPVQVWDLNESPLASVIVGPKGAHQAFKADIAHGVLDFGSVMLPAISDEAKASALTVQEAAQGAATSAESAASAAAAAAASADASRNVTDSAVAEFLGSDQTATSAALKAGSVAAFIDAVATSAIDLGGGFLYVSTTGNDASNGRTWMTAKRTVKAAVEALPSLTSGTESFHAGTVQIGPGEFVEDGLIQANREIRFIGANARSDNAGTTVRLATGRNVDLFRYTEAFRTAGGYSHGLSLEGFTIDANVAGQASTTLSAALNNSATTLTLAAALPVTGTFDILIDDELLAVTGGAGTTTLTVVRGRYGSVAATHASGATVRFAGSAVRLVGGGFNCSVRNIHVKNAGGIGFRLDDNAVNFHAFDFNASQCGGPAFAYLPVSGSSGSMISFLGGQIDDCGSDAMYFEGNQSGSALIQIHSLKGESRVSSTKHRHFIAHKPNRGADDASGFHFDIRNVVAYALGGGRESVVHDYAGTNQGASWELSHVTGKDGYLRAFRSVKYGIESGPVVGHLSAGNYDTAGGWPGRTQLGNIAIATGPWVPEGDITAPKGSVYAHTAGADNVTFYVKGSGAGNTGWVALRPWVQITQAAYDALGTKDPNTLYVVVG